MDLVVHAAHAPHTAATGRHTGAALVFLRYFGYHGFGGDQESLNLGCIRDRHANDLGRVDKLAREIQSCGSLVFGGAHYVPIVRP